MFALKNVVLSLQRTTAKVCHHLYAMVAVYLSTIGTVIAVAKVYQRDGIPLADVGCNNFAAN